MANWKFTDEYGVAYPGLANSILSVLVFDVPSGSPVKDGVFSAELDLRATGKAMEVLAKLLGMDKVAFSGTVSTADKVLTVTLDSVNNAAILTALAACIPLVGGKLMQAASLRIRNQTAAAATADEEPALDRFDISTTVKIGNGSGNIVTQVPMSVGLFSMEASFTNFGVSLGDLDFLVPGRQFGSMFPTDLPASYYTPGHTALNLLSLQLTLSAQTSPSLKVDVSTAGAAIGIVNIPLSPDALYLSPLSVWVQVSNPLSDPKPSWGLTADVNLYPYGQQTSPPSAKPDFTYELALQMPTNADPTFAVTGTYDNPTSLPVSQILSDLMDNGGFNTGIGKQLTLKQFEFAASADTSTGTIIDFSCQIAMDATNNGGRYFGLFSDKLGVKDFSIAVAYVK